MSSHLCSILASVLIFALSSVSAWGDSDARPIVVFRVDDCQTSWRQPFSGLDGRSGLEYGKLKRILITWAVVTDRAGDPSRSLTWAELKDYLDTAGGEVASHSVTHASGYHPDDHYISELIKSRADIKANLAGKTCSSFIQPGTWTGNANLMGFEQLDNAVGQTIQAVYQQSMGYLGMGWRIGNPYYRYGMHCSDRIDYANNLTPETIGATLDVIAATPGLVFTVYGHGIQERGGTANGLICADVLKAFFDKLAELRDQGKIRLMGLHEAFRASFPEDLNRIPDGGFEACNPALNPRGPWFLRGSAYVAASGGVTNSRYLALPDSTSQVRSCSIVLPPGRYLLSWRQKPLPGSQPGCGLIVRVRNYAVFPTNDIFPVRDALYNNADPASWEQEKALILIRERLHQVDISFQPSAGGKYGVDDVSIAANPLDPGISPSGSSAIVRPGECTISWNTPVDERVTAVCIRFGANTHPQTPMEGTEFIVVPAVPGTYQQATAPINWLELSSAYFSVFAIREDGTFSPPDILRVDVDTSPPARPFVKVSVAPNGKVSAEWTASESDSNLAGFLYSVGTECGMQDRFPWTSTASSSAEITGLPEDSALYFGVKSQNTFGYWSEAGCAAFDFRDISLVLSWPDGTAVTVEGLVSAVFGDCSYIEKPDRSKAIKVFGASGLSEGDLVTVSGILTTEDGERVIIAAP